MQFLVELWVPILVSVALCFIGSAVSWMVLPFHRHEWHRLPTEPGVLDALRQEMPSPGRYNFPFTMDGQNTERADVKASLEGGPIGFLTIAPPGVTPMWTMLGQMIVFYTIVTTLTAYVAWGSLRINSPYTAVFKLVGIVSAMAYVMGSAPESIWFARPWRHWIVQALEGIVFGVITAEVFAQLWP